MAGPGGQCGQDDFFNRESSRRWSQCAWFSRGLDPGVSMVSNGA